MEKTYLVELVRDVTPFWDQRDKNYHDIDLKPKIWDEIGETLNVTRKYCNNTANGIGYCLLIYTHTHNIFNIGTFYIRTVTVVTNIHLSYTLYITNVP